MKRIGLTAIIVVVAIGIGVSAVWVRSGDDPPPRSEPVAPDPSFAVGAFAGPYHVTYVVDYPAAGADTQTVNVWVGSRFESRQETRAGSPPGGEIVTIAIGTLDRIRIGGDTEPATVARVPGPAPAALHLAPIIDRGVDAGLLEVREQRMILGTRCQVYRSGSVLISGELIPISDRDHADTCVDGHGLILEETLVVDGQEQHTRTAVAVDLDPEITDDLFDAGAITAPVDLGGGAVTPAAVDSAPEGLFYELDPAAVPDGFRRSGRFSVIPPQPDSFSDPERRDHIVAGVADVYVPDDDANPGLFVIYQGGTLGKVEAFPPVRHALAVESPVLGKGELLLGARWSEVRFSLPGGTFLHVIGPLDPAVLEEISRGFEPIEGTGLELLE